MLTLVLKYEVQDVVVERLVEVDWLVLALVFHVVVVDWLVFHEVVVVQLVETLVFHCFSS